MFSVKVFILFSFIHLCAGSTLTPYEQNYTRTFAEKVQINPGCKEKWCMGSGKSYPEGMLIYTTANGPKDAIHHLFSTIGAPTVLMSRTSLHETLSINYTNLRDGSKESIFYHPHKPEHSFGIIFSRLYEFEDYEDKANLAIYGNNRTAAFIHSMTDLTWVTVSNTTTDKYLEVVVNATGSNEPNSTLFDKKDSYLSFRVRYDVKDGRLETRPHMEFTSNTSMITLVMGNLQTRYERSRFALEMVMFSTNDNDIQDEHDATQVDLLRSMDDEYSPGVFTMRNWYANKTNHVEPAWGYAQWKPVMYMQAERRNADLSQAVSYPNINKGRQYLINHTLPSESLFNSAFIGDDINRVSLNASNVSFGQTEDKFYRGSDYLVWTMSMGLGPAPEDDVSIGVIMVIAAGLGVPLILMILSSVYVCVKNYRKRKQTASYSAINS